MKTISTQEHGYDGKSLLRRLSVGAAALGILAAGAIAGAGNEAHAEPLGEPPPGITIPNSTLLLVRYGETDRAAGMPDFEYVEVVNARESPLGLDPRIARKINEGVEPSKSLPRPVPTIRVWYGETDRAQGMPEYEDVPIVGGYESPLRLDPRISGRIDEGFEFVQSLPRPFPTIRVWHGETDRLAGMPEYEDVPFVDANDSSIGVDPRILSRVREQVFGSFPCGQTDATAGVC